MKKVIRIDVETGIYIEDVIVPEDFIPEDKDIVTVDPPQGLYTPKWTGEEWVEGKPLNEIEDIKNQPVPVDPLVQLQEENRLLKAQNQALSDQAEFHEAVLEEIILVLYS